ncbi:hypothetical protein F3N42_03745 [Marinihelvus fidelis]|uniref:Uncharacterized protein n=1 Tax=Marinihelvus fidelis TaxID=2613842 RepID=A0A5N0TEK5_9GAMM|nr:hypothetical protein [Marinihelvus fidelis]KAA9133475.1 hypothetical protein F3N42_03745 [Marinihelvus fidelis]
MSGRHLWVRKAIEKGVSPHVRLVHRCPHCGWERQILRAPLGGARYIRGSQVIGGPGKIAKRPPCTPETAGVAA